MAHEAERATVASVVGDRKVVVYFDTHEAAEAFERSVNGARAIPAEDVLDLPLSVRLKNALIANGTRTFEAIALVKYRDLLKGRGVGVVSVLELDRYLRERGVQPCEAIPKWVQREARARERRRIAKEAADV